MKPKCYFCDSELNVVVYTFRVGPRDEPVCEECHLKTMNRQKAKAEEEKEKKSG
jgi:transposase-like protein